MEQNVFAKTNAVISKLKDILKCQLCCELKSHNMVFYYKSCGHFYCTECHEGNSCVTCIDKEDVPFKVTDDKNMLSLYESVLNLRLPPRDEVESILNSCQTSVLDSSINENAVVSNEIVPPQTFVNTKQEQQFTNKRKSDDTFNDKGKAMAEQPETSKVMRTSLNDNTKRVQSVDNETPKRNKPVTSSNEKAPTAKKKIDVNKTNHRGETKLHLACKKGDLAEIKNLIDAGASINAQDAAGWTPLHDSVNKGDLNVVTLLLQSGANINTPGLENNTPLHEAVINRDSKMCRLLMQFGADYKAKNLLGDTPLDIVTSFGNLELKEILLHTWAEYKYLEFEKPNKKEKLIIIWKYLLTDAEEKAVQKFTETFDARASVDTYPFCSKKSATHIVIPSDRKITLNWTFISSVLVGAWIVDSRWIFDSLKDENVKSVKEYAPTDEFFSGFEKSRQSKINQLPGLFSGCHFFFYGTVENYYVGKIKIMKDHLLSLVRKSGGVILKRSPDPESLALERTVPYHASEGSSIAATSYYIIYQPGRNEPGLKYNMSHMKTLPIDWLILCIFNFQLINPEDTEIFLKKFLRE